jgi:glycosyltransferase involved in cell wall biosynthesis
VKILLVIDHFGSGGAQRQIVELARGLRCRGHVVEMFVYFPRYDFFRAELERQVAVHEHAKDKIGSFGVVRKLSQVMRGGKFDVAISFQSTANIYAEVARLGARRTRLVVSERTNFLDDKSVFGALLRRMLHLMADRVVANSATQARWLRSKPWLRQRVLCIYNGVDLQRFRPNGGAAAGNRPPRLLGIGRVGPEKNLRTLILGLGCFLDRFGHLPELHWAGENDGSAAGSRCREELDALLAELPRVRERWRWLGLQTNMPDLLHRYDALVHPSLYEGSPNAVCEALASGIPVLASNVCDHPLLVGDGERGFLFDPTSSTGIAEAIGRWANLDLPQRLALGRNAREYAEAHLGIDRMVESYEGLCVSLLGGSGAQ